MHLVTLVHDRFQIGLEVVILAMVVLSSAELAGAIHEELLVCLVEYLEEGLGVCDIELLVRPAGLALHTLK